MLTSILTLIDWAIKQTNCFFFFRGQVLFSFHHTPFASPGMAGGWIYSLKEDRKQKGSNIRRNFCLVLMRRGGIRDYFNLHKCAIFYLKLFYMYTMYVYILYNVYYTYLIILESSFLKLKVEIRPEQKGTDIALEIISRKILESKFYICANFGLATSADSLFWHRAQIICNSACTVLLSNLKESMIQCRV